MALRQENQFILVTDIVGHTGIRDSLGAGYARLRDRHDSIFREQLRAHAPSAPVIGTGDGFLAAFDDVTSALEVALGFRRAVVDENWNAILPPDKRNDAHQVRIRIGMHLGVLTITEQAGVVERIDGQPVNLLKLMADLNKRQKVTNQILISRQVRDAAWQNFPRLDSLVLENFQQYKLPRLSDWLEVWGIGERAGEREYPIGPRPAPTAEVCTVVFCVIPDLASLQDRLGAGFERFRQDFDLDFNEAVGRHSSAAFVKRLENGYLATFPNAGEAICAARDFRRSLWTQSVANGGENPITASIGLDQGVVTFVYDSRPDVSGQPANGAARLATREEPQSHWRLTISKAVRDQAKQLLQPNERDDLVWRDRGRVDLAGVGSMDIFDVEDAQTRSETRVILCIDANKANLVPARVKEVTKEIAGQLSDTKSSAPEAAGEAPLVTMHSDDLIVAAFKRPADAVNTAVKLKAWIQSSESRQRSRGRAGEGDSTGEDEFAAFGLAMGAVALEFENGLLKRITGGPVNLARELAAAAKGGQILAAADVKSVKPEDLSEKKLAWRRIVRGASDAFELTKPSSLVRQALWTSGIAAALIAAVIVGWTFLGSPGAERVSGVGVPKSVEEVVGAAATATDALQPDVVKAAFGALGGYYKPQSEGPNARVALRAVDAAGKGMAEFLKNDWAALNLDELGKRGEDGQSEIDRLSACGDPVCLEEWIERVRAEYRRYEPAVAFAELSGGVGAVKQKIQDNTELEGDTEAKIREAEKLLGELRRLPRLEKNKARLEELTETLRATLADGGELSRLQAQAIATAASSGAPAGPRVALSTPLAEALSRLGESDEDAARIADAIQKVVRANLRRAVGAGTALEPAQAAVDAVLLEPVHAAAAIAPEVSWRAFIDDPDARSEARLAEAQKPEDLVPILTSVGDFRKLPKPEQEALERSIADWRRVIDELRKKDFEPEAVPEFEATRSRLAESRSRAALVRNKQAFDDDRAYLDRMLVGPDAELVKKVTAVASAANDPARAQARAIRAEIATLLETPIEDAGLSELRSWWAQRRDAFETRNTGSDPAPLAQLKQEVEQAKAICAATVQAFGPSRFGENDVGTRRWAQLIAAVVDAERDSALANALVSLDGNGASSEGATARILDAGKAAAVRKAAAAALIADMALVEKALDGGGGLATEAAKGRTVSQIVDEHAGDSLAKVAAIESELRPTLARVEQLKAIEKENDPARLLEILGKGAGGAELRVAVWNRLGSDQVSRSPTWLATQYDAAEELRRFARRTEAAGIAAVSEETISRQLGERWTRHFASQSAKPAIDECMDRRQRFGIDDKALASLPPAAQFNWRLWEFTKRLDAPVADPEKRDEEYRAAVRQFREAVPAGVREDQAVRTVLGSLAALDRGASGATLDASRVGPGAASPAWKFVGDPGAIDRDEALVYELPIAVPSIAAKWKDFGNEPVQIRFWPLGPTNDRGERTYLSETEVSVRLFAAAIEAANTWPSMSGSLKIEDVIPGGSVHGPRSWGWLKDRNSFALSSGMSGRDASGYILSTPTIQTLGYYPAGLNVPPPSFGLPMNYLAPNVAATFAAIVGCRLPTSAEWGGALASEAGGEDAARWNLRDQSLDRVVKHLGSFKAAHPPNPWNDALAEAARKNDTSVWDFDDGTVWFLPVDQPARAESRGRFLHIRGNVAEIVFDDHAPLEEAAKGGLGPAAATMVQNPAALGVIGGSSLSPRSADFKAKSPAIVTRQVNQTTLAQSVYSDVGLRLAFTARPAQAEGEAPYADRVRELVPRFAYLSPVGR